MPTLEQLIDEVKTNLQGYSLRQDRITYVNNTAGLTTTSLEIQVGSSDNLAKGLIEIDNELIWVDSFNKTTNTLNVMGAPTNPIGRGFQQTYGFIGGGHSFSGWAIDVKKEYNVPLTRDGQATTEVPAHLTEAFGKEAVAFIRRNAGAPWMLYLAFNAPHTPHMPTNEREKQFADVKDPVRRKCLAQISLMDDAVGAITKALADSGQAQDTLIFFFTDNGGTPPSLGADNTPLRGYKGYVYEGGVRVPFVISWPARLKAGSTYDRPVSSLDVTATALALAGVAFPTERRLDGVNLIPFLRGETQTAPHANLFWRTGGGRSYAVRSGDWKLVRTGKQPDELYDLKADIGEAKDLASARPEVVAKLATDLSAWDKELVAPLFQSPKGGKPPAKKAKK